jgi:hypothetical protein
MAARAAGSHPQRADAFGSAPFNHSSRNVSVRRQRWNQALRACTQITCDLRTLGLQGEANAVTIPVLEDVKLVWRIIAPQLWKLRSGEFGHGQEK